MGKNIYQLAVLCIVGIFCQHASAHSGSSKTRYVATNGNDSGDCTFFAKPCLTLDYAASVAHKGDNIRLAKGKYHATGNSLFILLSDIIPVTGGYSQSDQFSRQAPEQFVTTIVGIPFEYRQALSKKGFYLLADQKSLISQETKEMLAVYQKATHSIETSMPCTNGKAGVYSCSNVDLVSHIPLAALGSQVTSANDIWGFIDKNTEREYALIGLNNGTAIVDVTVADTPNVVASIPGANSHWRDIKVYQYLDSESQRYKAYAYVTTENFTQDAQGIQIIDLTQLPETATAIEGLPEFRTAHNVYITNIDYATGIALEGASPRLYIAGANKSGGAFRLYDLSSPTSPQLLAEPPPSTGYVHDATSLVIEGPRSEQCPNQQNNRCELVIDFNESSVDIWDFTKPQMPSIISSTPYSGSAYVHSGWWSENKNYLFIQDELDESASGAKTTLRTLDISNLTTPQITHVWTGTSEAIDHNGFTLGDRYYMSTYRKGLIILDVSNPNAIKQVGLFDTFPSPIDNTATFNGAWGVFPYLPSKHLLVSDIEYGFFVLKEQERDTPSVDQSIIEFEQSAFITNETSKAATITLIRKQNSAGKVSVQLQTFEDSATESTDYEALTTTVTWEDGDLTAKTVTINIIDDAQREAIEELSVSFQIRSGNALIGDIAQAKLAIESDDNAQQTSTPSSGGGALYVMLVGLLLVRDKKRAALALCQ